MNKLLLDTLKLIKKLNTLILNTLKESLKSGYSYKVDLILQEGFF